MEPKFQSSFIPKGPLATSGMAPASKVKSSGFFGLLCLFLFVLTLVGSVGIFGYNWYLSSKITKMGNDLQDARAALEPETIKELARLDARIVATKDLLNRHVVLSPFFDFIENSTLKSVRFSSLEYSGGDKGVTISMKGQAHGYASVALQADIFNKSKYIKQPIFSNLTLDDKGNVTFVFTANIDPVLVSFKKYIEDTEVDVSQTDPVPSVMPSNTNVDSTTGSTRVQTTATTSTATSTPRR